MESTTLIKRECTNGCPVCCIETVEEINAHSESTLRHRSLTLSGVLACLTFVAYWHCTIIGKAFVVPDFVWVIIASPWCGAGMSKLMEIFLKGKK